ncbi:hypothetical protein [Kribbella sp. NPDC055071]
MSFKNLTLAWTTQPLSDPALAADVVDLMITLGERQRGTFTVLLCDPDDTYRATISIDLPSEFDQPTLETTDVCSAALAPIIPAVHTAPGTSLILALGRPGPPSWPDLDVEWAHAATHICQAANVRLLGFYIATATGIHQPLLQSRAAA